MGFIYSRNRCQSTIRLSLHWQIEFAVHGGNDVAIWTNSSAISGQAYVRWVSNSNNNSIWAGVNSLGPDWKYKNGHDNLQLVSGVWGHKFSDRVHMMTEAYYEWERDAALGGSASNGPVRYGAGGGPGPIIPGISGAVGAVNYFQILVGNKDKSYLSIRNDYLDDINGWRTGYVTTYISHTIGFVYYFTSSLFMQPEIRYDYTVGGRDIKAYDLGTKRNQFSAATDLILRFQRNTMVTNIVGAVLIFVVSVLLALPVAKLMKKTYSGERNLMDWLLPLEKLIYKICRINAESQMDWKKYLSALLVIQICWFVFGFIVLLVQGHLFLNPAHIPDMEWTLAFNSTVSFLTSTNLQHYSGETGATYLSQLCVFMFLQFVSAATSLCAGVAVVRGLASHSTSTLGNFYVDFVRSCTRILLPLCIVAAVVFMLNGMPMTFKGPEKIVSLQGDTTQVALGPVAAMISIKELGSNGGGFFGTNSAHPFENPNFITFIVHIIIVLLLPVAFVFFIGMYLNNKKFCYMLFAVMLAGLVLTAIPIIHAETAGNPHITAMHISQPMGNMEGKEVRFGGFYSAYYSAVNMAVPAGTITGMHDSYMPLSAIGMLTGMQVDAFFGGLGTGWVNMFIYLIIAVFIASLMIGRTPELLGRKISLPEIQVAVVVNILSFAVPLILSAIACYVYIHYPAGGDALGWLSNKDAHGFTTMFYEYVSCMAGNGSEFSGLGNNTPFWNLTTCIPMLLGRYIPIIGAFVIIGSYRTKLYVPPSPGTLKTESATFGALLFCLIIVMSVLSMFIVFILGPLIEHFQHVA